MNNNITIQISAKTYWGFKHFIDKNKINFMTHDEIIEETKDKMKKFFKDNNLLELKEGIDKLNLHIHDNINDSNNNIIYLCDKC